MSSPICPGPSRHLRSNGVLAKEVRILEKQDKSQWVFSSRNNEELAERYAQWAKDYDTELERDLGWRGPRHTAELFAKYMPRGARVLDAGAGTD